MRAISSLRIAVTALAMMPGRSARSVMQIRAQRRFGDGFGIVVVVLWPFTKGFTYMAGMMHGSCPSALKLRLTKCALNLHGQHSKVGNGSVLTMRAAASVSRSRSAKGEGSGELKAGRAFEQRPQSLRLSLPYQESQSAGVSFRVAAATYYRHRACSGGMDLSCGTGKDFPGRFRL